MFKRTVLAASFTLLAVACASSPSGGAASQRSTRASRDVIGREELSQSTASNALDAIRQLRPQFLQGRGAVTLGMGSATSNEPTVYLDEQRLGGLRELSAITISDVDEIRYLSASDATQRFGTGNASGAIVIKRRRAGS
jgi:hypothetical protein